MAVTALGACDKRPDGPGERPPPVLASPTDPGSVDPGPRDNAQPPPDGAAGRTPIVGKEHPLHARVEGPDFVNACSADGDCYIGGCSSEVCSAEQEIMSDCALVERPGWPSDAACGCVTGRCQWWSVGGTTLRAGGGDTPTTGQVCGKATCGPSQTCVEYYGIAGATGAKFQSCEIPCKGGKLAGGDAAPECPGGMECVTIADGPGSVCRPKTL